MTPLFGSGSTSSAIAATADDTLYQSYDLNAWAGYRFDVANGTYQVTLKMMEDWATAGGQRRFDVRIESSVVLTAFDIFASCGKLTACDRTFTATVTDGQLNVAFNINGGANYATVSAIEITSGAADTSLPTAPANLTVTGKTSSTVSLSWTASTDNVGVTAYDVYNGTTPATTVTGTTATITGLGTQHHLHLHRPSPRRGRQHLPRQQPGQRPPQTPSPAAVATGGSRTSPSGVSTAAISC